MSESFEVKLKVLTQRGNLRLVSLGSGPIVVQEFRDKEWVDLERGYTHNVLCQWIIEDEELIKNLSSTLLQEGETNI